MTNLETVALSHTCYRLANAIRYRRRFVLLGLTMAILPSLVGMFSLAAIMGGLLLGCLYFLDTLRIAKGAIDEPFPLFFAGAIILALLSLWKPDDVPTIALNAQVIGLGVVTGVLLTNYFSDVFVAVLEARKQTLKETAISPAK